MASGWTGSGSKRTLLPTGLLASLLGVACGSAHEAPDGGTADASADGWTPDGATPDGNPPDGSPPDRSPPDGEASEGPRALPRVETGSGAVVGTEQNGLRVFRGIPYAAPPMAELRFRPPEPHPGWSEPLDATAFGPECPQRNPNSGEAIGEEDCLALNIWAHAAGGPRPVMVFIHGGGMVQGSGSRDVYEGSALARGGDVVVVTFNYRLGALGFLATEALAAENDDRAGNYGLLDQVAALAWVQQNIAAFGGDPDDVTIFGESAGGVSVCVHLGSPLSEGLYRRAIIESGGGCYNFPRLREATATRPSAVSRGNEIVAAAGCDGASDELACMRALTPEQTVGALWSISTSALGLPDVGPAIDGYLLLEDPWESFASGGGNEVPIITGSNADEANSFTAAIPIPTESAYETAVRSTLPEHADDLLALYPASDFGFPKAAFNAMVSDLTFICPALSFAGVAAGGPEPAYTYHFTHLLAGPAAALGAFHALELAYVFGNLDVSDGYTPVEADHRVSEAMMGAWTSFAHGGTPPALTPSWPAYDPADPAIAIFDDPIEVADRIREGRCAELEALGLIPAP